MLMTVNDIAAKLGLSTNRVNYILLVRHISPAMRAGVTRLYSAEQFEAVRSHVGHDGGGVSRSMPRGGSERRG